MMLTWCLRSHVYKTLHSARSTLALNSLVYSSCFVIFLLWVPCANGLYEKVCEGIYLRNGPNSKLREERFKTMVNCTVIEGDVYYLLSTEENLSHDDYKKLQLPNVVEITGSLFVYEYRSLRSLDILFPELRVIRGHSLVYNYALVIYQNNDIKEIGLTKLKEISRGGVRIEGNDELCFVDTINWTNIVRDKEAIKIVLSGNKNPDQCDSCKGNFDSNQFCAVRAKDPNEVACWNAQTCQTDLNGCPSHLNCANGCSEQKTQCCHAECVGGCVGPKDSDCFACRHVRHDNRCISACPPELYKIYDRRCVTERQCSSFNQSDDNNVTHRFKAKYGCCAIACPSGSEEHPEDSSQCIECNGVCTKTCTGRFIVSSSQQAKQLRECSIINGSLEISIRSGKMDPEIADDLGNIQVVTDYVKINFCVSLVTMDMLSSLKEIRGEKLWNNKYALAVFENENLAQLWQIEKGTMAIKKGKVQFQNNPYLCYSTITAFLARVNGSVYDKNEQYDISTSSNGNKAICEQFPLSLVVTNTEAQSASLSWSEFNMTLFNMDERQFLGYRLYYKALKNASEHGNVSIYEERDACYDSWQMKFIDIADHSPNSAPSTFALVKELEPNTQYAFYVNTLVIQSNGAKGGISDVVYAQTKFMKPSEPIIVDVRKTADSLLLTWEPPHSPFGQITHYRVEVTEAGGQEHGKERNYCQDPPKHQQDTVQWKPMAPLGAPTTMSPLAVAATSKRNDAIAEHLRIESERSKFEDFIQDIVFTQAKRTATVYMYDYYASYVCGNTNLLRSRRLRRQTDSQQKLANAAASVDVPDSTTSSIQSSTTAWSSISKPTLNDITQEFPFLLRGQTNSVNVTQLKLRITNLRHFTKYSVRIAACQNVSVELNYCSESLLVGDTTTDPIPGNDRINQSSIEVTAHEQTQWPIVRWDPPSDPNGVVLAYNIQLTPVDSPNNKPFRDCESVSNLNFSLHEGYSPPQTLSAGKYYLSISVITFATMNGSWSEPIVIEIPGEESHMITIVAVAITGFAICMVLFGVGIYFLFKQRKKQKALEQSIISVNPFYWTPYQADEWELNRDDVKLISEVGMGQFGKVWLGEGKRLRSARGDRFGPCAVKMLKTDMNIEFQNYFLREASILKKFDTEYVVKLYGVVSNGQPAIIVMELMQEGSLKDYLRKRKPEAEEYDPTLTPPSLEQVLQMAGEVADGMAYLESKKFVHGDLAARNCLVATDLTCKIGDFGMARDMENQDYYRLNGRKMMPVRWMAPETFKDNILTSKCDVWSYGVLLWEMVTLCQQPYHPRTNDEVIYYVGTERRLLPFPRDCPEILWRLMTSCWRFTPKERPCFLDIVTQLLPHMNARFTRVSFCCSHDDSSGRSAKEQRKGSVPHDDVIPLNPVHHEEEDDLHEVRSNGSVPVSAPDHDDDEAPVCLNNRRKSEIDYSHSPKKLTLSGQNNYLTPRRPSPPMEQLMPIAT